MRFSLSKIVTRSTRIRHTDLCSSYQPLIFSAGSCVHLRSESTVLGRKLMTKRSTFNLHNFVLSTNWIFCGFFFQKHPNSPKIIIILDCIPFKDALVKHSPNASRFSSLHRFLWMRTKINCDTLITVKIRYFEWILVIYLSNELWD